MAMEWMNMSRGYAFDWKNEKSLRCLDIVFVIDSTGSMNPFIEEVKSKVIEIIKNIEKAEIGPLVNFGIVVYGDHPPQDTIITKSFPLTNDHEEILRYVRSLPRTSGGDYPEAVVDGLRDGIELAWRRGSHRVLVLMGDAPPHGYTADPKSDHFPRGCPCGQDPFEEAKRAREKGIIIYSVGVNALSDVEESFQEIAKIAEGEYLSLEDAGKLPDLILKLLMSEVRKMETDIKAYTVVQKTQVFNPDHVSATLGLSRQQAEQSLTRLKKKGLIPSAGAIYRLVKCSNCGLRNSPSANFCRHCGKPLRPA